MADRFRPIIVGGGLAGSAFARELTKVGEKPIVIEKNSSILNKACTGLVSKKFLELVPVPKSLIKRKVDAAVLHFPDGDVEIKGNEKGVVIDRDGLLEFLKKDAKDNGADYLMDEELLRFVVADKVIGRTSKRTFKTDIMIGADGAGSVIRQKYGLNQRLETTTQAFCEHDSEKVEIFLGKEYGYPFGYVVPYSEGKSIIGIGGGRTLLDKFMDFVGAGKVEKYQSGAIPVGLPKHTAFERVILAGDAGGFVKAFSGGSISLNLLIAKIGAKAVKNSYEWNDFSTSFLTKHFEKKWEEKYMKQLKRNLLVREVYENMGDKELSKAFGILNDEDVLRIISEKGDIDFYADTVGELIKNRNVRKFGWRFLLSKPWLIRELFRLF